ncbi:hypothetical protein BASA61_009850 [Batrachochytrium salamandrivorans]|nr:hypothetical protein BASA61_009850 [Batrachochytrium salamandrivorans]
MGICSTTLPTPVTTTEELVDSINTTNIHRVDSLPPLMLHLNESAPIGEAPDNSADTDDEEDIPIGVALMRLNIEPHQSQLSQQQEPSPSPLVQAFQHRQRMASVTHLQSISLEQPNCLVYHTDHQSSPITTTLNITSGSSNTTRPILSSKQTISTASAGPTLELPRSEHLLDQPSQSLLDDEQVSLAVSVRLREAAAEFVRLDEHALELAPSEFKIKAIKQKVEHVAAEIRGTENEVAYLRDQWERDALNLSSPFISRAKRAEIAEGMALLADKRTHVSSHLDELTIQFRTWSATKSKIEHDIRNLQHIRNRMQSLFERVFNGTRNDFPLEAHLAELASTSQTMVKLLTEDVASWETVRSVIQRMDMFITERWIKLRHLNPGEVISNETPYISELQSTLDNLEIWYAEVRKLQPSLPRFLVPTDRMTIGSDKTLVGRFVVQTQPRSVGDIGRLVYDVRAIQSRVAYVIHTQRGCLKEATIELKANMAALGTRTNADPAIPPGYNFIQSANMRRSPTLDTFPNRFQCIRQHDSDMSDGTFDDVHNSMGRSINSMHGNGGESLDGQEVESANRLDSDDDDDNPVGLILGMGYLGQASRQSCPDPVAISAASAARESIAIDTAPLSARTNSPRAALQSSHDGLQRRYTQSEFRSTSNGSIAAQPIPILDLRPTPSTSLQTPRHRLLAEARGSRRHSLQLSLISQPSSSLENLPLTTSDSDDDLPLNRCLGRRGSLTSSGSFHRRRCTVPLRAACGSVGCDGVEANNAGG